MIDVIVKLTAIYHAAKDIHYATKGENFYAIHLLMDRICAGIQDQIDEINEVFYLGHGQTPPASAEVLKVAIANLPEVTSDIRRSIPNLATLISYAIDSTNEVPEISAGEKSLIDDIQKTLLQKYGLLNNTVSI